MTKLVHQHQQSQHWNSGQQVPVHIFTSSFIFLCCTLLPILPVDTNHCKKWLYQKHFWTRYLWSSTIGMLRVSSCIIIFFSEGRLYHRFPQNNLRHGCSDRSFSLPQYPGSPSSLLHSLLLTQGYCILGLHRNGGVSVSQSEERGSSVSLSAVSRRSGVVL